jgi:hypothetical protein
MKTFEYTNYDAYVKYQIDGNHRKVNKQLAYFDKFSHIEWIKSVKPEAKNIICHGTRRGGEQQDFLKLYPDAYVIGTEISDTATQFPLTIEHDFNIQKQEWINKFDILYSNSFDHSFNIEKTIKVWADQMNKDGKMFIEWNIKGSAKSTSMDPVSGTIAQLRSFFIKNDIVVETEKSFPGELVLFMCTPK